MVQNKASIAANTTQHQLIQEAAERQLAEDRAGKQLERVQTQNAELVYPVYTLTQLFMRCFHRAALECGLEGYLATFAIEFVSPPAQPHATVYYSASPKHIKAIATSPFACTLPPNDLARLATDPTKRARWVELATHTLLPVLRELVPIIQTKVRRATHCTLATARPTTHSAVVLSCVPRGRCTWRSCRSLMFSTACCRASAATGPRSSGR